MERIVTRPRAGTCCPNNRIVSTGAARRWLPRALLAAGTVLALAACGGGEGGGSPNAAPATSVVRLCPAAVDYSTPYLGGTGSGELVKVQIDTKQMTWAVTFLDSSVPRTPGTVQPTRSDTASGSNVISGTLTQETGLPTDKLNQCAFRLNGASLDPARPARLFLGEGVMGGTIPGARIQFNGVAGAGAVPDTTFPYFQFIGFSQIESDLTKVAGNYNGSGFHEVPSKNFQWVAQDYRMSLAADGSFTVCDNAAGGACRQKGNKFTVHSSGALLSTNYAGELPPTLGGTMGRAYLIVGKLRGALVPVMIRVGYANASFTNLQPIGADDEIGIGMMAPAVSATQGSLNGEYIGVDSNFEYRTTALVGDAAAMLDPFRASDATLAIALKLDYSQTTAGVIRTTRKDGNATTPIGKFMFTGGVFGFLESRGGSPYFTIGAFVE
ncbi:DUF2957 domain-containing protein [Cupriavidus plantarum]|uniref:DUF2957 domain-containing protein n=1 Tax=Cupriavidus plantarum TaxID=942865 RepID=UPI000E279A05|nr:DUF2957 domain-containing protein [Cupriavidus plantarum]REE92572.1 hypothetical protein C7418_3840 [Cupriavidus plantarum]